MRDTQFTASLPTRTTLRETARWPRRLVTASERATHAAVVIVAVATFVAGASTVAFALAVALAALHSHLAALLAVAATVVVAVSALPLLALRAAARVALTTE